VPKRTPSLPLPSSHPQGLGARIAHKGRGARGRSLRITNITKMITARSASWKGTFRTQSDTPAIQLVSIQKSISCSDRAHT